MLMRLKALDQWLSTWGRDPPGAGVFSVIDRNDFEMTKKY